MSHRLKILLNNGKFLTVIEPDGRLNDYLWTLSETDGKLFERLNKGLKDSQGSWMGGGHFSENSERDQSTYYKSDFNEFSGGQSSSITSTPSVLPWRFRSTPQSKLNELFWPTQLQRHAEMYVAFSLGGALSSTFMYQREKLSTKQAKGLLNSVGIDRVYILFGSSDAATPNVLGPYFYMRCAGLHIYNNSDFGVPTNGSVFILKLVDDRYYWNRTVFDPSHAGTDDGSMATAKDYFDWPVGVSMTKYAREAYRRWSYKLDFTDKPWGNRPVAGIYQFGFTIYPHSLPSSGVPRGIMSDHVAWSQGFIPVVVPNFDSFTPPRLKSPGDKNWPDGEDELRYDGYALMSFAPAYLGEHSLYPRDRESWLEDFFPIIPKIAAIRHAKGGVRTGEAVQTRDMSQRTGISPKQTTLLEKWIRDQWPDTSFLGRTKGTNFIARVKFDIRENDILYGQRFIANCDPPEYSRFGGGDQFYHRGTDITASKSFSEKVQVGDNIFFESYAIPTIDVNTALFSNEYFDTSQIDSDYTFTGQAPTEGTYYCTYDEECIYSSPGANGMLKQVAQRLADQYAFLHVLDAGPESTDFFEWNTRQFEVPHHVKKWGKYFDVETGGPMFCAFFDCYESYVFRPFINSIDNTNKVSTVSQCSATGTSYRRDAIPQELAVTWNAPYETLAPDSKTTNANGETEIEWGSKRLALDFVDNGQQIYAEGIVVKMPGYDDETYFMKIQKVKPSSAINANQYWFNSANLESRPIVKLHHPDLWPDKLIPGTKISCLRMPEKSERWWSPQWIPLAKEC